jgi:hypothetical protein
VIEWIVELYLLAKYTAVIDFEKLDREAKICFMLRHPNIGWYLCIGLLSIFCLIICKNGSSKYSVKDDSFLVMEET